MKIVSLLVTLLIIALLLLFYLRPWSNGGPSDTPPTERFMRRCSTVFADRAKPRDYCECLWREGVRDPTETLTKPAAKAAASACE
jgi:hypothetical protein